MDDDRRKELSKLLDHPSFNISNVTNKALQLYDQALTHSSYAKEMQDKNIEYNDNERLEFLGNFVLGLVVSEYLFKEFDYSEGEMTKRMEVVSDTKLAEILRNNQLGFDKDIIRVGNRNSRQNKQLEDSILACAFEAFIGVVYLDRGLEKSKIITLNLLGDEINNFDLGRNYIGRLQEFVQKKKMGKLNYLEKKITGPDHRPTFRASVNISGKKYGTGTGANKKSAKMAAAKTALQRLVLDEN